MFAVFHEFANETPLFTCSIFFPSFEICGTLLFMLIGAVLVRQDCKLFENVVSIPSNGVVFIGFVNEGGRVKPTAAADAAISARLFRNICRAVTVADNRLAIIV